MWPSKEKELGEKRITGGVCVGGGDAWMLVDELLNKIVGKFRGFGDRSWLDTCGVCFSGGQARWVEILCG